MSTPATETADVVVIGAGVSGLGYANWYRAKHPGARVVVLEREPEPGGYCRTVVQDGFVWDYSGHFFHFKDPAIEQWLRDRMPGEDIRTVEKRALIRYAGRDIDFPFQTHIHQLPHDEFLACLVDLYFRPTQRSYGSFGEMLEGRLGKAIVDKFLRPYNEKLYATKLEHLDPDAMGRFFPHADIADIIANMRPQEGRAKDRGYNATFTYPAGGAIRYIHALLQDLPANCVACDEPVVSIDLDAHVLHTPRRAIRYGHVVSSAPMPALARMANVVSADVFSSNRVLVFNLGFDRKGRDDVHWMYFPDPSIVFYRVGWYDNIMAGPRASLYVEIGAPSSGAGGAFDVDALRARVLADLAREGIIDDHRLVAHHHVVLDPAYCHITERSIVETARLRAMFAAADVHAVGRYGAWTYCSIEDNLLEVRALAEKLA
ncbi:MAG: NAD(P)-binding protein, partial [Proteobacteria bacterium]|nr:NAD(P)-binding protein [Pseudomonadota bacterium]